jgi:hypothetical protein
MANSNVPNDASAKSQAEGDRESNPETVDRYDETTGDEGGGITNRPLDEEVENQAAVPERGKSKPGAHAGHGDGNQEEDR